MTTVTVDPQHTSWGFTTPDKILVATDLVDLDYLIAHAIAQSQVCGAVLVLAHASFLPASGSFDAVVGLVAQTTAEAESREQLRGARRILNTAGARVRAAGVDCQVVLRHGHPREVIPELVREVRAGRLVLGTHGRHNLKKFFLGSTAHEILKSVTVPVWTVGPRARPYAHGQPHRILHPVSLSSGYEETARLAVKLGQCYQAEVTLLHVLPRDVEKEYIGERLLKWTTFELGRLISEQAPLWTTATIVVEAGEVVEQILLAAGNLKADLIVMGANPHTAFWPTFGDNTVYNVIAEAKCPVLTMRHSQTAQPISARPHSCVLI
jgi:nucleotide-binding universal stress UspA family protein